MRVRKRVRERNLLPEEQQDGKNDLQQYAFRHRGYAVRANAKSLLRNNARG